MADDYLFACRRAVLPKMMRRLPLGRWGMQFSLVCEGELLAVFAINRCDVVGRLYETALVSGGAL